MREPIILVSIIAICIYELTRYNSVVNLTNRIASEYPKQRYTIISTTDEIYQVIESGWHEEILDFYYKSKLEK